MGFYMQKKQNRHFWVLGKVKNNLVNEQKGNNYTKGLSAFFRHESIRRTILLAFFKCLFALARLGIE